MLNLTFGHLLKNVFFYFITSIISFRYFKCLKTANAKLFRVTLKVQNSNYLQCNNGLLAKSKINIQGKDNQVINEGEISGTEILIVGMNNRIRFGKDVRILNAYIVMRGMNCEIEIGNNSTFGKGMYMVCMGNENSIKIGADCMFADNVEIWNTDSHAIKDMNNRHTINISKPVNIGDKTWIGKNTVILKGVNIGSGSVIGINSLVTKSLPENTVCVGNPAKPIRENIYWERSFIIE
jgi:acetyltransferase-like isoleucine patch superfamily enzyme